MSKLNPFRSITTAMRLDKQIEMTEESLITNMHNAAHFAAMAEGNRKQLTQLRAMKAADAGVQVHVTSPTAKVSAKDVVGALTPSKPRLATSK